MTLNKALKILGEVFELGRFCWEPEAMESYQLGIEALKRVKDSRGKDPLYPDTPLPGETEE